MTTNQRNKSNSTDVGRVVLRAARATAGAHRRRSRQIDVDDYIGGLALAVCERLSDHNPQQAPLGAFCHVVAESAATNLWRHATAQCRDIRVTDSAGFNDELASTAMSISAGSRSSSPDDAPLTWELCAAVESLPAHLREVCRNLSIHSKEEVARGLRISKAKLYRDVSKIRAVFIERGLHAYLAHE